MDNVGCICEWKLSGSCDFSAQEYLTIIRRVKSNSVGYFSSWLAPFKTFKRGSL